MPIVGLSPQAKLSSTYLGKGSSTTDTSTATSTVTSGTQTTPVGTYSNSVQSPSPYQVSGTTPVDMTAQLRAVIRANGSVYDTAFNLADPQQFAMAGSAFFDGLKKTNVYGKAQGFANDLEYLQAAVRAGGLSKGTSNVGDLSLEDYNAIQKVFQTSYIRGYDWATTLQRDLNSPYLSNTGNFAKTVSTSMQLLDATDAENRLSDAYFKAFGIYPSQDKIASFRSKYNAEAKKQQTVTTTLSGTSGTKTTSGNEGFTAAEQKQFLADFLKKNYKITGKEQSGYVANVIDALKNAYAANMIPEEDMNSMISFAADLIGTSDTNVQDQKVNAKLQTIRNIAAKQYMGLADTLAAGQDAAAVVDPIVKQFNSTLGTNIDRNDARIKQVVNYNDGKATRVMNASELQSFIEKQPEFQTSAAGYAKYAGWGQAIKDALR